MEKLVSESLKSVNILCNSVCINHSTTKKSITNQIINRTEKRR